MALSLKQRIRRLDAAEGYLLLNMTDHALAELWSIPDPAEAQFEYRQLLGECFRARQDWAAALSEFERCYALQPQDLDVLMALAWCYKRLNRLPHAIAVMQEAYELHRDVPVVLYNLSCYYSLSGNKSQALSWLGRALRMERKLLQLIPGETDFAPLRNDPEFCRLLQLASE